MINGIQLANKLRGTAAVSTNLPDEIRDLLFQAAYAVDRLLVLRPGWEGSDHSDPPPSFGTPQETAFPADTGAEHADGQ